jgi:hypothetical protein
VDFQAFHERSQLVLESVVRQIRWHIFEKELHFDERRGVAAEDDQDQTESENMTKHEQEQVPFPFFLSLPTRQRTSQHAILVRQKMQNARALLLTAVFYQKDP